MYVPGPPPTSRRRRALPTPAAADHSLRPRSGNDVHGADERPGCLFAWTLGQRGAADLSREVRPAVPQGRGVKQHWDGSSRERRPKGKTHPATSDTCPSTLTSRPIAASASSSILNARRSAPSRAAIASAVSASFDSSVKRSSSAPVRRTRLSWKPRASARSASGVTERGTSPSRIRYFSGASSSRTTCRMASSVDRP